MLEGAALDRHILDVAGNVPDPEIPAVTLGDLGIVRGVRPRPDGGRDVALTPTYTGCPATLAIEMMVRGALDGAGLEGVGVRAELSPPWTTDWISDEGREKLRVYGIAPPEKGAAASRLRGDPPAACPRCGSTHTEEVSRFGSTPCKAMWRCLDCREPFDRFKCL
ncbi:phenylacetate-CoA oxygenase subunit PaaJ [Sphingomonas naphthae]|uniref:Phenylacetate-CoA oxygenase subunit PaaJ n=1 Tax=Sphingomonas naphthae TaxID=1813468 RepID=A0ABY7TGV5_9SPHN|nr:1,2-phenylacetyl-CoA epoxidase subunit PaaD [Sphingomonas naphthae]WCT72457.1 phenylacetate-CoA oxygenase subunit PaaJ [Sphingomonas naphthae]